MATEPGSAKARRKLTTYGKTPHREGFDFDVPDSPEPSEDELAQGPAESLRLKQTLKSSKLAPSSQSPRRQPIKQGLVSENGRNPGVSTAGRHAQAISSVSAEVDPFDVPSSEDDKAAAISPLKPVMKRRRLPGNGSNGTLAPSSSKSVDRTPQKERPAKLLKQTTVPQNSPPKLQSPFSKDQGTTKPERATHNKLSVRRETPRSEGDQAARPEAAKRKARDVEDVDMLGRGAFKSTASPSKGRARSTISTRTSNPDLNSTSKATSITSAAREPVFSISQPHTPPAERRHREQLTPDIGRDVSQKSAFSYMSPSGLDFLGLDISGSPSTGNPKKDSQSLGSVLASTTRKKLKDRLATRDGSFHQKALQDQQTELEDETMPPDGTDLQSESSEGSNRIRGADPDEPEPTPSQLDAISTPRLALGAGPRHTYAARNRTLRKDENATEDDMFASLAEVHESPAVASRRIRTIEQIKSSQEVAKDPMDFDDSEDGQTGALRNIHELREAGASARLQGETEALLDEIESSNPTTRRNGLLALLTKLNGAAFRDQFTTSGLDNRLLARTDAEMDLLSKVLTSMALLQLLASRVSPHALAHYQERNTLAFLESLLNETDSVKSVARNRKSNATKALQQEIDQVGQSYLKLGIWKFGTPTALTPRIISLSLLDYLMKYIRESGTMAEVIPTSTLSLLTSILACSPALAEAATSDLDLRTTVSILESSTLGYEGLGRDTTERWLDPLLEPLADILTSACGWQTKEDTQALSLLLRLGLNVTNKNASACAVFARSTLLQAVTSIVEQHFRRISHDEEPDVHAAIVDNLVLSLGFLINLAENSRAARELCSQSSTTSRSPLDTLLGIFTARWIKAFEVTSEQESRESVPLGYLSVLLAFVCIERTNRTYVASKLEGDSLKHLLIAVDAFLSYHRKVAEELHRADDGSELKAHFVGRVQAVLDQLKETEMVEK